MSKSISHYNRGLLKTKISQLVGSIGRKVTNETPGFKPLMQDFNKHVTGAFASDDFIELLINVIQNEHGLLPCSDGLSCSSGTKITKFKTSTFKFSVVVGGPGAVRFRKLVGIIGEPEKEEAAGPLSRKFTWEFSSKENYDRAFNKAKEFDLRVVV